MEPPTHSRRELEKKSILELLQLLTDEARLQKARGLKFQDIRIVFQTEEGYMYEIRGAKNTYFLRIDRKNRALVHNCEDFLRRGLRDGLLCKHFTRIFQEIYEKEAKEILIDLLLNPWVYLDSDEYLKKIS